MKQPNIQTDEQTNARAHWIGTLARARSKDLEHLVQTLGDTMAYTFISKPQVGLVMARGRAGGTGQVFNLGEVTATRCSVRIADGTVGFAFIQGRDEDHAERAAVLDALLQGPDRRAALMLNVIEPLQAIEQERRREKSRKAATTKVEFFTMSRSEKPT